MRKETKLVCTAFAKRDRAKAARTETDGTNLWLFGNRIAWWDSVGLNLCMCGYGTVTTRDRLNGVLECVGVKGRFSQRSHVQHYNDEPIGINDTITVPYADLTAAAVA